MSAFGTILLFSILLTPWVVSTTPEQEPSDEQHAAIEQAVAWLRAADPDPKSIGWPYHFGASPACVPHLTPLMEAPRVRREDGQVTVEPASREGWWLVTDLETNRFWLLVSEGYFGPAHYYGPAVLTIHGELEPSSDSDSSGRCDSQGRMPPN